VRSSYIKLGYFRTTSMAASFKVGDHVSWNSEAGRVGRFASAIVISCAISSAGAAPKGVGGLFPFHGLFFADPYSYILRRLQPFGLEGIACGRWAGCALRAERPDEIAVSFLLRIIILHRHRASRDSVSCSPQEGMRP